MDRHLTKLAVSMICLGGLGAACTNGDDVLGGCPATVVPRHDENTLVIAGDPWSGYAPFRDPTLLDGSGYGTLYVEQICQDVRADDLDEGRTDVIVTTLDQYLLNRPDGTVVGVIDQSSGADALALNTVDFPYLRSVDDIPQLLQEFEGSGERPVLAYTGGSPSEMLLNELANTTEILRLSRFELVSVDQSATAYRMMQDHEAQLAVIWAPDTSAAEEAGYTIALSSADVPGSIVDVIVAGNDLIGRDPNAVPALLDAYYTRIDAYLDDRSALEQFIADDGGLDLAAARSVLDGMTLYGSSDADAFMNDDVFPLDRPLLDQSLTAIGAVLALIHPEIDLDAATIDGTYLRERNRASS